MFEPQDTARVFALPLGADFAREFIAGLRNRMSGQPPEAWAKVKIYVNTRRSARRLEELLAADGAMILPDIRVITALASDPMVPVPRAVPPLRRRLILAQLVARFIEQEPDIAPKSALFDLADSLGELIDLLHGEGLTMAALAKIDVEDHSAHWARALRFLEILTTYWHEGRAGLLDGEERQRAAAAFYAAEWAANPPDHPILVAGSTGSRGATAIFMEAVSKLPQGAIILPGYDYDAPPNIWDSADLDHPQFGFKQLREKIGFGTPSRWITCDVPAPERNALVSLALRPAPVTDQWLSEGPALAATMPVACKNLTLLEAPGNRDEADAIAIRLRQAIEDGQTAALVSPDRNLTRRVTSVLARWNIVPDDSAGQPLPLTPPGIFFRAVIHAAAGDLSPANLLAILKHPLCGGVAARGTHLKMVRQLEHSYLRGGPPHIDWDDIANWANGQDEDIQVWVGWLQKIFTLLAQLAPQNLRTWLEHHRIIAMGLSAGFQDETPPLMDKNAGKAVQAAIDAMMAESDAAGILDLAAYQALFSSVLQQTETHEDAFLPHPSIAILGTLEARVQSADLVILGGLNEGIWPKLPEPDPWLSRNMRAQIGLPLPERQTGLSAHDFQQAIAAKDVVLSRAIRDGEAQTVAARWIIRLTNLMTGLTGGVQELENMKSRGRKLLMLADAMNRPGAAILPAARPSPSPPIAARPEQLSVTRIETLIRDPYAIYADKVLGLRKLDPLGKEADALERGVTLHKVMEAFVEATKDELPENAEQVFVETAKSILSDVPWPSTRQFWLARLSKIAPWFVEGERVRRSRGNPSKTEISGSRRQAGFTLTANADRIDVTATGVAIYDYKSGSLPSKKQIKEFAVQLPLEGAIAQSGGFDGLGAAHDVYLELIGLGSGGKELSLDFAPDDIAQSWENLLALVQAYGQRAKGYTARARSELLTYKSDYDHLARFGEWQDGDPFIVAEVE